MAEAGIADRVVSYHVNHLYREVAICQRVIKRELSRTKDEGPLRAADGRVREGLGDGQGERAPGAAEAVAAVPCEAGRNNARRSEPLSVRLAPRNQDSCIGVGPSAGGGASEWL